MLGGECSACCGGGGCCYFRRKPAQNSSSEDCGEWFAVIEDCTYAVNPPFDCNRREIGPYATKEIAEEEAAESLGSEEWLANSYNVAFFDPETTCCNCGGEQPADTVTVLFTNISTDDPAWPNQGTALSLSLPRVVTSDLNRGTSYTQGWDSCFRYGAYFDGGVCGGAEFNRDLSVWWRRPVRNGNRYSYNFELRFRWTHCRRFSNSGQLINEIAVYGMSFTSTEADIITKESCSLPQTYTGPISGTSYSSAYNQTFSLSMDFSVTMDALNPLP